MSTRFKELTPEELTTLDDALWHYVKVVERRAGCAKNSEEQNRLRFILERAEKLRRRYRMNELKETPRPDYKRLRAASQGAEQWALLDRAEWLESQVRIERDQADHADEWATRMKKERDQVRALARDLVAALADIGQHCQQIEVNYIDTGEQVVAEQIRKACEDALARAKEAGLVD